MQSLEEAVVDANVLIHGRGQVPVETVYMPPSVEKEIRSEISSLKMQKFNLETFRPSEDSLEKVGEKSGEIYSPTSGQDEEALALALDRNVPLVTDDKALQNLALHLDAEFEPFNTEKVSEKRAWKKVCSNCGNEVSSLPCPRCGSRESDRKQDRRN
jgi:UPF0271 protein